MALYLANLELHVISAYAPTSEAEDAELETFYDILRKAVQTCRNGRVLILGDFNAKLKTAGSTASPKLGPVGPFLPVGQLDRNAACMTDFLALNGLYSMASWFQHKWIPRWDIQWQVAESIERRFEELSTIRVLEKKWGLQNTIAHNPFRIARVKKHFLAE
jgi:hypothetical protein